MSTFTSTVSSSNSASQSLKQTNSYTNTSALTSAKSSGNKYQKPYKYPDKYIVKFKSFDRRKLQLEILRRYSLTSCFIAIGSCFYAFILIVLLVILKTTEEFIRYIFSADSFSIITLSEFSLGIFLIFLLIFVFFFVKLKY